MSAVVIAGDVSGTVTLDAPAVAGSTVLTLPATSGTLLAPAPGTSGNVLTSTGTGWTSSALPAGGVTSLNGQTGAITTTTFGAIGSIVGMFAPAFTNFGDTTAGSNITGLDLSGFEVNLGLTGTWRFVGRQRGIKTGNITVRIS